MGRFFLALLMVMIMISACGGVLFGADKLGLIKLEKLILQVVSFYPKLKDLPRIYQLGKAEQIVLEREKEKLQALQKQLHLEKTQLTQTKQKLHQEQLRLKEELKKNSSPKPVATPDKNAAPALPRVSPANPKEIKDYLEAFNLMKPAKVAVVLQKLPEDTVLEILKATEERQTAKIFECLPAEYLASLTKEQMSR